MQGGYQLISRLRLRLRTIFSSVATGGHAHLLSTGIATGFVQIRDFLGVRGCDSSPPDLLADREGAHFAAPPQKPHPRIGPSGHVTGVHSTLKS